MKQEKQDGEGGAGSSDDGNPTHHRHKRSKKSKKKNKKKLKKKKKKRRRSRSAEVISSSGESENQDEPDLEVKEQTSPPNTSDGVQEVLSVELSPDPCVGPLNAGRVKVEDEDIIDVKTQL